MKTTRYFVEQVLRKRPYLSEDQCATVLATPSRRVDQADGRIRWWGHVTDGRDGSARVLRVVTLADGETVHNAFYDRSYREEPP